MTARHRQPRGSIYVLVLSMSMLVAVIGMGAVMVGRVEARTARASSDFATARLNARAGIELAMFKMQQDPNWRTDLGNGAWFTNVPLSRGTFSVSAADPVTGNITVASNDPVVLTSTGNCGAAAYTVQQTVQVNPSALGCLAVASCSASDTNLNNCAYTANQTISSNGKIQANGGSVVNANAQAVGGIGGGAVFKGSATTLTTAVAMPDPTHVFDTYNAKGTTIPLASLLQSNNTQLVSNPSFETNTTGWYVASPSTGFVTLAQSTTQHQDGSNSLKISGRLLATDVPATDLPLGLMRSGDMYAVSVPVYAAGTGNVQATLSVQATGGNQTFSTSSVALKTGGGWVTPSGNLTVSWTGTITKATLTITTTNLLSTLYIDKVSVTDSSLPSSAYVMDRVLLSPASNPYGATNASGIYIINCNNQKVTIGPCRIVGTLVLLGLGSGSTIQGPVTWEPAVTGYPALLTDTPITISMPSGMALSESTYGVNFNPTGTPYPYVGGTANATITDAFPSVINGLIYCGGNLTLAASTAPTFNGCIVTAAQLLMNATSVNLTYGNASYVNPPPGFGSSTPSLYPVAGTSQRVSN